MMSGLAHGSYLFAKAAYFSTDIDDHKMLEQRLKQSNEAARAAEAEHKKRAEDALETRRQQEFFIV